MKKITYLTYFLLFIIASKSFSLNHENIKQHCSKIFNTSLNQIRIDKIPAGVSNSTYLISIQDNIFIGKIFNKQSIDQINEIEKHISHLRRLGFSIPQTHSLTTINNKHPFQVTFFKTGTHIKDIDLPNTAKLMAKLHKKSKQHNIVPKAHFKTANHYQNLFKKCHKWKYTKDLQQIYNQLDLSYCDDIPMGLIHGDFSYSNILKNEKSDLILIDFEHLCSSFLLTDLTRCQMFYGFDQQGHVLLRKIQNFAYNYNKIRALTTVEKENFFTHMKLVMIDTALEMYYHTHITKNISASKILHEANKTLEPTLLVKKIKQLSNLKKITINNENQVIKRKPIVFFGLSGVGKTTLINGLAKKYPQLFYIPVFTCTRNPRDDDNPQYFEYISVEEFKKLQKLNAFTLIMREENRYYGYRKEALYDPSRFPLMNSSPYGLENVKKINATKILINGNAQLGLQKRNNPEIAAKRTISNKRLSENFYNKSSFINEMDFLYWNDFSNKEKSIQDLKLLIFEIFNKNKITNNEKHAA